METYISDDKINLLINRYTRYVENIQWHLDFNKPHLAETDKCNSRISDFKTVIDDLKNLLK